METIINQSSGVSSQLPVNDVQTLADSGFHWREKNGVKVLVCTLLETAGFTNGFSTRLGGVSHLGSVPPAVAGGDFGYDLNLAGFDEDSAENIHENRRRFLDVFEDNFSLSTVWQVHGDAVKVILTKEDAADAHEKFDALVSDLPGILIGVKTADCVPILLGDTQTGAFATVHAGWRGTVQSIAVKAIDKMKSEFGTVPVDLICAIGPAAGYGNYEVGQDVIDAFDANFSTSGKYFTATQPGHALIDLQRANRDQLTVAGVLENNICTSPFCTMERTDLFFSYRKEKKLYGKTGRLLSVIGKPN